MLKSITLRILNNVARHALMCNECRETLNFFGMNYLKMIANERGWKYNEVEDRVYCWHCQEKNKKV